MAQFNSVYWYVGAKGRDFVLEKEFSKKKCEDGAGAERQIERERGERTEKKRLGATLMESESFPLRILCVICLETAPCTALYLNFIATLLKFFEKQSLKHIKKKKGSDRLTLNRILFTFVHLLPVDSTCSYVYRIWNNVLHWRYITGIAMRPSVSRIILRIG